MHQHYWKEVAVWISVQGNNLNYYNEKNENFWIGHRYFQAKSLILQNKAKEIKNLVRNNSNLSFCNYFALGETKHNNTWSLESPARMSMLVIGLNDPNMYFTVWVLRQEKCKSLALLLFSNPSIHQA